MNKLLEIINSISEINNKSIKEDSDLIIDLGFDSVKFIQLISEIEESFNIEFEIDELDLKYIRSIKYLNKLIESKIK